MQKIYIKVFTFIRSSSKTFCVYYMLNFYVFLFCLFVRRGFCLIANLTVTEIFKDEDLHFCLMKGMLAEKH